MLNRSALLPYLGRLTHYKGGVYSAYFLATHTETEKQLVIYRRENEGPFWARPREDFFGKVMVVDKETGGMKLVQRFTHL